MRKKNQIFTTAEEKEKEERRERVKKDIRILEQAMLRTLLVLEEVESTTS